MISAMIPGFSPNFPDEHDGCKTTRVCFHHAYSSQLSVSSRKNLSSSAITSGLVAYTNRVTPFPVPDFSHILKKPLCFPIPTINYVSTETSNQEWRQRPYHHCRRAQEVRTGKVRKGQAKTLTLFPYPFLKKPLSSFSAIFLYVRPSSYASHMQMCEKDQ